MTLTGFARRYGFALILAALVVIGSLAFWNTKQTACQYEAATHGQPYDPDQCQAEFWAAWWENSRSEYEQLLLQFLGMVALARWLAYRAEEQQDRIEAKLDRLNQR